MMEGSMALQWRSARSVSGQLAGPFPMTVFTGQKYDAI
jgi:hypothetical protein